MAEETPQYVVARVQRALTEDDRTNEQGIQVDIRRDQLFLRGKVTGEERRRLVALVAAEAAPGMTVHNEIIVVEADDPGREELL